MSTTRRKNLNAYLEHSRGSWVCVRGNNLNVSIILLLQLSCRYKDDVVVFFWGARGRTLIVPIRMMVKETGLVSFSMSKKWILEPLLLSSYELLVLLVWKPNGFKMVWWWWWCRRGWCWRMMLSSCCSDGEWGRRWKVSSQPWLLVFR